MNQLHSHLMKHLPSDLPSVKYQHALRTLRHDQQRGLLTLNQLTATLRNSVLLNQLHRSRTDLLSLSIQVKRRELNTLSEHCRFLVALKQVVRDPKRSAQRTASLQVQLGSVYRDAMRHDAYYQTGACSPGVDVKSEALLTHRLQQLLVRWRAVATLAH